MWPSAGFRSANRKPTSYLWTYGPPLRGLRVRELRLFSALGRAWLACASRVCLLSREMAKHLVITEKPSVARDIVSALGGFEEHDGYWESSDYVVTFAIGHILELVEPEDIDPKYKRWTLDTLPILPKVFPLRPKKGASERLRTIKKLLSNDEIAGLINACDAGREGELIFREIVAYFESDRPIKRLWLQSMTKAALRKGFEALQDGESYEGLSRAAHCRNYSDWVIGMNATRALTRRLKSRSENQAWSAGRVQTPTLGMLVKREVEVLEHRPVPFWRIRGHFLQGEVAYEGVWFDPTFRRQENDDAAREDRIFDEAKAKALAEGLAGKPALASETRKPSKEAAPPLFDLTSLQREGNRRFGWSARRTLNAAQRCYEGHKVLTYPRTDARALPSDYRGVVDEVIGSLEADPRFRAGCQTLKRQGLLNTDKIFDDSKVSDHFAIVPTGVLLEKPDGDDGRLFELVTRRFLAAFHPPALWSRVERITTVESESFRSRAKILQEPGWRAVLGEAAAEGAPSLPHLVSNQDQSTDVGVGTERFDLEEEETKPPPRITEARLLSLMENAGRYVEDEEAALALKEKGIGTPATRADTIENLISKGYVMRAGRALRPSVKGIRLIDILERMQADRLASPALTGELEHHLTAVEKGERAPEAFMDEVYEYASDVVDRAKNFEFEDVYPNEDPLGPCPLCQKPVYERSWFYRCLEPPGLPKKRPKKKKGEPPEEPEIKDCPFRIWKDKSGRYVDRATVVELLQNARSRVLDGFLTRQGRSFRGHLLITDGEIVMERDAGGDDSDLVAAVPEYEVSEIPLGSCPECHEGEVVETRSTFLCTRGLEVLKKLGRDETTLPVVKKKELETLPDGMDYCAFLMPRTVCKRELTREEMLHYMEHGRTELLTDFISQRGRPFSAILFRKETRRHGFEFPPRGGAKAKGEGEAPKATKKKATKKKATKKKTTKKKATKKKATKKKTTKKKTTKKKTILKKAPQNLEEAEAKAASEPQRSAS